MKRRREVTLTPNAPTTVRAKRRQGGQFVDLSKFKPGDWLLVAGGAVMLIFGLALNWTTADFQGFSDSGDNAFDYFFTGGIAWLLVVGAAVITVLLATSAISAGPTPWTLILLLGTGLATLLMLIRLILGGRDIEGAEELGVDVGRGAGMYVAFIAAALALAGAVMKFTGSGGKLSDLTDMDKMRDAFKAGGGGSSRPGSSTPPPPPPPPPAP
jgi:hypothetical protein